MQAYRRNRADLMAMLRDQVELLRVLGTTFDSGQRIVAYPLATTVRVLVHDTASSHALLAQLGELSTMQFCDTSLPFNPRNLIKTHGGLVVLKATTGTGAEWAPRCEVPVPVPGAEPRDIPFQSWWETDVISDSQGTSWSRRRMVLAVANKEGGAHIDPSQPVDVRVIEEENSMGFGYRDPIAGDRPMSNGPLLPSIRQSAYELEQSITKHLTSELSV
jgi:hypothetical protein